MLVFLLTSRPPFASTATSIRRTSIANPSSELPNQEDQLSDRNEFVYLTMRITIYPIIAYHRGELATPIARISDGRQYWFGEAFMIISSVLPHFVYETKYGLLHNLIPSEHLRGYSLTSMFIQATLPQLHPAMLPLRVQAIYTKPNIPKTPSSAFSSCSRSLQTRAQGVCYGARRRVRYEDDEDEDEEYGHNEEIAILESYSESAWSKALLVRAIVDGEEEEVLIFRGFSSCLSSRTATDPSRSVLPAKAIIKSIDVIKGPFDPSNVEYLEKDLTWESFKARLQTNQF